MIEIGSLVDGKYRILHKIGQGGMSVVYLALNERAGKQWAIKEVRKSGVSNYQVVKQSLIVETEMLKSLSHPYLPSIVDIIDEEDSILIVMDYIEGNTLGKALATYGVLSQEYVIEWAKQLCDVLGYLHTRKPPIIYRDLKPDNIMLRPDGTITLIDFGTARTFKERNIADTTYLGTRGYAAPEQFGGYGQTDQRTDIYCLGSTLYHLVTGMNPCEPPFEFYPIRSINPQLSRGLEKIIAKCLRNNPDDRYNSCAEVLYDLEHYKELDNSYRKKEAKKLAAFGLTASLAIASAGGAVYTNTKAEKIETTSYEKYLVDADTLADASQQVGSYQEAIVLNPGAGDAYIKLINNVYLADDNFSPEEDQELRSILITPYDKNRNFEDILEENKADYDEVAYQIGLAYYYDYDEEGNKSMSVKWLGIAAASDNLDESKVTRAERLSKIAQYYSDLGRVNKKGDLKANYAGYWEDLKAITEGNIAEMDNTTTALMIYKEMIGQINTHSIDFIKAGVEIPDMEAQIKLIEENLEKYIMQTEDAKAERISDMIAALTGEIDRAKDTVNKAYKEVGKG
ncbi:serine/threonine protein kinase [Butyrivibrio sp. JL13D10]|uniref:serine/threonine protein kinase n=1 Tax=Butyrivibrio sp. JL13D10 TaxID=3236815 RepID=UPI0038B5C8CE